MTSNSNFGTARTYAFVGFIFYALSTIGLLVGVLAFALFFATSVTTTVQPSSTTFTTNSNPPSISNFTTTSTMTAFSFFGIFVLIFLLLLIVGITLTVLAWNTVRNIDRELYGKARSSSLILGIIGLFFGVLIGGIFFLLAYAQLGESATQRVPVQPLHERFCVNCGRAVSSNDKFCAYCGKELPP